MAQPVGVAGAPAKPPPPKAPPPSTSTGNNPHGVAIAPPPKPTVNDRQAVAQTIARATAGTPRGTAIPSRPLPQTVNDVQAEHPDPKATIAVFKAQPIAQQRQILQNAQKNPSLPVSKILLGVAKQQVAGMRLPGAAVQGSGVAAILAGSKLGGIGDNFAKDLWNLPGGTVEGLYTVGKDIVTGHEGAALNAFVDPYIQLAEHPIRTFEEHPLDTGLMVYPAASVAGRAAGAAMRTGALGEAASEAASTVRAPLHVGTIAGEPSPITEARNFSPNVLTKAFQVAKDNVLKSQGKNPNVVGESALPDALAYSMNRGIRAKLYRQTDEMTATHQSLQRTERNNAIQNLRQVAPSKEARNVVSHVLQGVIRKPETAIEDTSKEINRLKAAQPSLSRRSVELNWNRQQVRDLSRAIKTPGALDQAFGAADTIRQHLNSQDAALVQHGMLDPEQAMRSKLMPYAMAHMGAKYDHVLQKMVNADGSDLSSEDILNHLKENGVPDPGYVGHFNGKVSPGRFYSAYRLARGSLGQGKRTGERFRTGAYDHTWDGLIGQTASRAQSLAKAGLHDRVISRFGVTVPREVLAKLGIKSDNGDLTPQEAKVVARAASVDDHGNKIPGALDLTPISRAPKNVLDSVRDLQHPNELGNISQLELKALADAVSETARRTDGTRNVTLVPSDVVKRFGDQYSRTDSLLKNVGKVTQQFRRTVLPYSTHWMTQIGSEAALRSILGGVLDPRYLREGRALTHYLEDTPEGRAVNAEMTQSTLYNGGGSGVKEAAMGRAGRGALDIHNPNAGRIASAAKAFPPSKLLIAAHNRYADTITSAMYGLEHNARMMGLGKIAHKEVQSFGFKWSNVVRLQGHAIADLGEKLKDDPALTAKFGREIDQLFGKYSKFTPTQRAMVQSFTPFLPWYLNAAKYVMWHLPAKHPVATGLLASLRQTVNQDIKDGKQLPLNEWAMQELARISPFGIFTPPSTKPSTGAAAAGQQFTGAILPQLEGSLYNFMGQNSFGSGPLKQAPTPGAAYGSSGYSGDVKPHSGPATAAALENLGESLIPLLRYVKIAEEGGKPSYGTATVFSPQVKPGGGKQSAGTLLNRIFNPFYSVQTAQGEATAPKYGAGSSTAGSQYLLGGTSGASTGGYLLGGQSTGSSQYLLP